MYEVIPTILIATHKVFIILIIIFNKYSIFNPHTGRGGGASIQGFMVHES